MYLRGRTSLVWYGMYLVWDNQRRCCDSKIQNPKNKKGASEKSKDPATTKAQQSVHFTKSFVDSVVDDHNLSTIV